MKFTKFELNNVFAYEGQSVIDLSRCTDERNIVFVQGPNGAGKTSLLNAIKLLFVGVDDDRLRRVIQGQAPVPQKQFVLGTPGRWYGLLNRHARESGARAHVALEWEKDGSAFRAERSIVLQAGRNDYQERLSVWVNRSPLDDKAAQALLESLLPSEIAPFFFFDGEQIQSLADAKFGREQVEIERLLGLSFLNQLTREVASFEKSKKTANLPADVAAEIVRAEGDLAAAEAKATAANKARVEIEEEREDLGRRKAQVNAERNALRNGLSDQERQRIEGRIEQVSSRREKLASAVASSLPPLAPIYTNLPLVNHTFALLDEALSGAADANVAERIYKTLPDTLIDGLRALEPSVELNDGQKRGFRTLVSSSLKSTGLPTKPVSNPVFNSLSPRQLKELRDSFHLWANNGPETVASQAAQLREIRVLLHEERALRRELHEAELSTEEARARFDALTTELETLDGEINDAVARHTAREIEEKEALKEVANAKQTIEGLYEEYRVLVRENGAYQLARKTKAALEAYREECRKKIRASVERRLNSRIEVLLAKSGLVRSVKIDDNFSITYFDDELEEVARHSLSAGMRQLAAMAMLWALKEEADKTLPVAIDTPLGRIDAENRNLLMTEYFPKAGNPLILLPTNSEIDPESYADLSKHVAVRYAIENSRGTSAKLVERPLSREEAHA